MTASSSMQLRFRSLVSLRKNVNDNNSPPSKWEVANEQITKGKLITMNFFQLVLIITLIVIWGIFVFSEKLSEQDCNLLLLLFSATCLLLSKNNLNDAFSI